MNILVSISHSPNRISPSFISFNSHTPEDPAATAQQHGETIQPSCVPTGLDTKFAISVAPAWVGQGSLGASRYS